MENKIKLISYVKLVVYGALFLTLLYWIKEIGFNIGMRL